MARGESPYQGRYTVPTVDFSPIERGGAAWGRAFEQVGGAIAGGIKENRELKGKLAAFQQQVKGMEGDIHLYLSDDPEEAKRLAQMVKTLSSAVAEDADSSLRQKVARFEAELPLVKMRLDAAYRNSMARNP